MLAASPASATNYLLIIADDLGADKVSSYVDDFPDYAPDHLPSTTAIDSLATAGLRFTTAWATPMCSPTRATIETGLLPFHNGVGRALGPYEAGLDPGTTDSLGERVGSAGYATGFFGKWHLGSADETGATGDPGSSPYYATPHPGRLGYEQFDGTLAGTIADYEEWEEVRWSGVIGAGQVAETENRPTERTVDAALEWIGAQRGSWLAVVSFHAPHAAGYASEWHYEDAEPACYRSPELACLADESCDDEDRAVFQALTECMDIGIEDLLDGISPHDLDDTVILFVGDNGTPAEVMEGAFVAPATDGGPARGKGGAFEGSVHVPLVVADGRTWRIGRPGTITSPGRVVTAPVHTVDLYATLVEATTGRPAGSPDARSFASCFDRPVGCGDPDRLLYTEQFQGFPSENNVAALRRGDDRLTVAYDADHNCLRSRYYRLDTDPYELHPIRGASLAAQALRADMARLHAGSGSWADQVLSTTGWCGPG